MAFHNLGQGLENMHTEYKSLKFGKDIPGGGNSNQPYITKKIPTGQLHSNLGKDFLLRGGLSTPKRIADDVSRLTQMMFDTKSPNGLLFIAKQNLLSRVAVATQASGRVLNEGAYLPTSTIANIATAPFGFHLNKQGLDPTKITGAKGGGSLFDLLGIKDPLGLPVYGDILKKIRNPKTNRLLDLTLNKITFPYKSEELYSYSGGPGSVLGIGRTRIGRYDDTTEFLKGVDGIEFKKNFYSTSPETIHALGNPKTRRENDPRIIEIGRDLLDQQSKGVKKNIVVNSAFYKDPSKRIEQRVNLGNPGSKNRNLSSYTTGANKGKPLDKINAYPIYQSTPDSPNARQQDLNDLVQFRIGVIDNDDPTLRRFMHFRAYIDNFSDSYNSEWTPQKFMGRGENLYKYNSFDRKFDLSWTVAATSKEELIPMYKKLNYLASTIAPDYSKFGYMRGNLISVTLGGYLDEQIGILTSINYSPIEEGTWEIGIDDDGNTDSSVKELPHIIKVTGFSFIPIHSFTPQVQKNVFDSKGDLETEGKEQYISLSKGDKNNYLDGFDASKLGGFLSR